MSNVEPEVWMVQWTYDGEVWVDAHADEPRARDQARDRGGECLPMVREASYASSQAEIERLRTTLEWVRKNYASGNTTEINTRIEAVLAPVTP